jgi:hypothetical protein
MNRAKAYALMCASPAKNPAARLPDEYVGETSIIKLKFARTIASDGAGKLAFALFPDLSGVQYAGAVIAGDAITWNAGTQHPDYVAFNNESVRMRFLAAEAELSYVGAEQTSAGRLSVMRSEAVAGSFEADITAHFDDLESHNLSVHAIKDKQLSVILNAYDRPVFLGNGTPDHSRYFPCITMVGTGLEFSKPVIQLTYTVAIEFVSKPTSLLRHHQRLAPVAPNQAAEVARMLADAPHTGVGAAEEREDRARKRDRPGGKRPRAGQRRKRSKLVTKHRAHAKHPRRRR